MAEQPGKGDRRALLAIVGEGFFSRLSFGVLNVALPVYAVKEFGFSLFEVTQLIVLNTIVAMLCKPLMGGLADRFGHRLSLNVAVVLRSAVTAVLAVAAMPWHLFAARAVHGVSIGLRDPVVGALIAEHGGKKRIAQSFAWYQTAKSVAGNAGKALAPLLFGASYNFSLVFLVAFALSLLPVVLVAMFVREPKPGTQMSVVVLRAEEKQEDKVEKAQAGVPRRAVASFMGLGFLTSASANMLSAIFPLLVLEYAGLSPYTLSFLYSIATVVAFSGPIFGWLSDNIGNKVVLTVRSVANILSSLLYIVAPNFVGFAAGRALDDMGKAAFKPAWGALMAELSSRDKRRRAQMFGYMTSGEDAGEIVGPLLAGFVATGWALVGFAGLGIPAMLGVRIVLAATTEVYTVAVTHKYLEPVPRGAGRSVARRLAIPARVLAGVIVGFGTGWMVRDLQQRGPEQPTTQIAPASSGAKSCATGNPTVDAIREQTGGC